MLTIRSWNVENAVPLLPSLAQLVTAFGAPDVMCLQELRIRPRDEDSIAALTAALPGYTCHYALADDPRNVTYRGGRAYGVATFAKKELRAHPHGVGWDREGRVVVSRVGPLAIVNLYAVNGTSKPYFDHALGRIDGDRHQYKRRFMRAVAAECETLRAAGASLVVIGDFNISRAKIDVHPRLRTEEPHALARAQLNDEIMPALDVVDIFRELHPAAKKYTWFNRRARRLDAARVDYALISRALVPRVVAADVDELPPHGDHAPLWLTLDI